MRKSHFNDEFLVLLGPMISRLFTCSNAEKNKIKKTKGTCSSPTSMVVTSHNLTCLTFKDKLNKSRQVKNIGWK